MRTILAGTARGLFDAASGLLLELEGRDVIALAVRGMHRSALVDGTAVWATEDATALEPIATIDGYRVRSIQPSELGLLVGTSEARLARVDRANAGSVSFLEAFDRTEGRDGWYTPWGGPPDSRSISADAAGGVYVNVHVGGIVRSLDAAETWEPTIDVDSDVHQVTVDEGGGLLAAATARGLATSRDRGTSWSFDADGLHASYCRAVALAGDAIVISASTGPSGGQAAVYRRRFGGGPFVRCEQGLPTWFEANIDTACVVADGDQVAIGTSEGSVFVSEDGGSTWSEAAAALPAIRCLALA